MGIETGTTISALVATNPVANDSVGDADNHLRLIKTVLKDTFPGTLGAGYAIPITATEQTLNLLHSGTGTPESAVTAPVGSIYLRTNGGANTTLYIKESGTGNTGWVAK
jgi:hypothetical protein